MVEVWPIHRYFGVIDGFHIFAFRGWGWLVMISYYINNKLFSSQGPHFILAMNNYYQGTIKDLFYAGVLSEEGLMIIYELHRS